MAVDHGAPGSGPHPTGRICSKQVFKKECSADIVFGMFACVPIARRRIDT